jgi:teichuronic acid biosynthesis glycosyltransferase TuaH
MPAGNLRRLPDWLVLGQEPWDEVQRRNQLLIRALAGRHPRSRFLFAELPYRPRDLRDWRPPRLRRVAPNIWAIRPIRPLPGARLQRLSDWIECAQLRRAARALGLERPMLWTQDPRAATLVELLDVDGIVYDLTDDWAAFESDPLRRAAVQERIESLAARADLVLACSRPLERDARAWSEHVRYLPNAVEAPVDGGTEGEPADVAALPRPRIGYAGTLHASRLDVELLRAAALLRPAWSFVLLGPDELSPADSSRLHGPANVHHLGVRPHAEVRGYLTAFDVCLVPHVVSDFTRSLDPLKLYEYLAAGRPVVATPVGNAPDLAEYILLAATPQELVEACERAIAADSSELAALRRGAVAGATWDERAEEIESALGAPRPRDGTNAGEGRDGEGESPRGADGAGASDDERVSAVVVSFNTRDLLERCLLSLRAQAGVKLQTIVVDNASTDGSRELVRERFPEVELIELAHNMGFGPANNIAFERCDGEYVLLLNSDAFLADGALAELVATAARHPHAGAVGPRLLNPDGTLQRSAWPFPHAGRIMLEALGLHRPLRRLGVLDDLGTWEHDEERPVDFLIGACLLLRSSALSEVGGFDEAFWLYGEEADLQRRLAARGWQVVFTPRATAAHVGGASSARSQARLRSFYAGQRRFLAKHGTVVAAPTARLALLVGSALRRRWRAVRVALERPTPRRRGRSRDSARR